MTAADFLFVSPDAGIVAAFLSGHAAIIILPTAVISIAQKGLAANKC